MRVYAVAAAERGSDVLVSKKFTLPKNATITVSGVRVWRSYGSGSALLSWPRQAHPEVPGSGTREQA